MKDKVIHNTFFLYVLQGVNFILPLVIIPFLINNIGIANFGRISFATAIASVLILITDFGFNYSGVRQISLHSENVKKRNEIYTSIFIIKLFLLFISSVIILLATLFSDKLADDRNLIMLNMLFVLGHVLISAWYFQGMQDMKYIALFNAASKIVATILILIFVNNPSDVILVPTFYAVLQIMVGILAIHTIIVRFGFAPVLGKLNDLNLMLRESKDIFIMNLSSTVYTNMTLILIAMVFDDATTGIYAAVDRLINAGKKAYVPLLQAFYPISAKVAAIGKSQLVEKGLSKLIVTLVVFGLITLITYWCSEIILSMLLGNAITDTSILLFKILLFVPIATLISNVFGIHVLFNLGERKAVRNTILFFTVFHIILLALCVRLESVIFIALITVLTEFCITITLIYRSNRLLRVDNKLLHPIN